MDPQRRPGMIALALAQRLSTTDRLAARIIGHQRPLINLQGGQELIARYTTSETTGTWAEQFAARFTPRPFGSPPPAMDIAPFAPPQRQISSARQGALDRSGGQQSSGMSSEMAALLRDLNIEE